MRYSMIHFPDYQIHVKLVIIDKKKKCSKITIFILIIFHYTLLRISNIIGILKVRNINGWIIFIVLIY